MTDSPFIHLAVRSSYSLLESMISAPALAKWAAANAAPAVAVTDRNALFGALELSESLSAAGVQPIMACCFDLLDDPIRGETSRISLYAQNEAGWRRLMALSSHAWLDSEDGQARLTRERLFEDTTGLICLTGGAEGRAGLLCAKGKTDEARAELEALAAAFPNRLYVEITRHGSAAEAQSEPGLIDLAYALDLPLVATHDARFLEPSDAFAHDALMCIANSAYLGQEDRKKVEPSQYLATAEEMRERFADLPEAIENTVEIARRCAVKAETGKPILPAFSNEGRSEIEELRHQAEAGLAQRLAEADRLYADEAAYRERLAFELGIIEKMGFPGYFLIVSDFIKWAKARDIPVGPGRGSGAGSLVAWSLLITDLDPIRFGLLFERFLNPERVSMPDFDVDFCQERRGEVIRYVRDKYGKDSVAAIITFGTLQAKAVVRDVGRVMQMPFGQVDRLAKLIPFNPAKPPKLQEAIDDEPKFDEEIEKDPRVRDLLDTALALEGLYRNAGTHAAGVVIGDRPLVELAPLYNDPRSELPATQFNMKWAELAGLVKFDFLGLKTLTVIQRALAFLERQGKELTPAWTALDDEKTYELMSSGDTLGVFQLEGTGMRDTLKRVKPNSIEDVIAIISLYRPGPMDNIPAYCEGKDDPATIKYPHPDLEPILKETYGIPVYQEQVMRMAQTLAGYSLGEADLLRRAMGKKKQEEMDKQRARFVKGAGERDIAEGLANQIFDMMAKFAGYGFNKSHAAAYAVISYQTGYLKANHPVEFLAASMSLDLHNTDKLAAFVQEARRMKIPVELPDVNASTADFDVRDGAVVYALGALKGVGLEAMKALTADREANGAFKDLHDLADRVDPKSVNKKAFEQLARAGALDSLEPNRARALAAAPVLTAAAASAADDRAANQSSLFGEAEPAVRSTLPAARPWSGQEKLDHEFAAAGLYLSGHPLDDILENIDRDRATLAVEVAERAEDGKPLELIGVVRARIEKPARNGGKFAFVTLSDPSGEIELMVMPELLADMRDRLEVGKAVTLRASVRRRDEEIRLTALSVAPIEQASIGVAARALRVRIGQSADPEILAEVVAALKTAPDRRRGAIYFDVTLDGGRLATVRLPGDDYAVGLRALQALKSASGVEKVISDAA